MGLGLGIPLIVLAGIALLWFRKRRRRTARIAEMHAINQ